MSAMRKRTNLASEYKETSKLFEDSDAIPEAQVPDTVLPYPRWFSLVSSGVGVMAMIYCTCYHCWLIYTLHENNMWFTNIKVCAYTHIVMCYLVLYTKQLNIFISIPFHHGNVCRF